MKKYSWHKYKCERKMSKLLIHEKKYLYRKMYNLKHTIMDVLIN